MESTTNDPLRVPPDKANGDGGPKEEIAPNCLETPEIADEAQCGGGSLLGKKRVIVRDELKSPSKRPKQTCLCADGDSSFEADQIQSIVEQIGKIWNQTAALRMQYTSRVAALDTRLHAREAASNAYKFSGNTQGNTAEVNRALFDANIFVPGVEEFPARRVVAATTRLLEESEKIPDEDQLIKRASEITKKNAILARERLPKQPEALRSKCHWDYLLDEMSWLASDMAEERRWKIHLARKVSGMVLGYWEKKADEDRIREKLVSEEYDSHCRAIAKKMADLVEDFWISTTVMYPSRISTAPGDERELLAATGDVQQQSVRSFGSDNGPPSFEKDVDGHSTKRERATAVREEAPIAVHQTLHRRDVDIQPLRVATDCNPGTLAAKEVAKSISQAEESGGREEKKLSGKAKTTSEDDLRVQTTKEESKEHPEEKRLESKEAQATEKPQGLQGLQGPQEPQEPERSKNQGVLKDSTGDTQMGSEQVLTQQNATVLDVLTAHRNRTYPTEHEEKELFTVSTIDRSGVDVGDQKEFHVQGQLYRQDVSSPRFAGASQILDFHKRRLGCIVVADRSLERRRLLFTFFCELAETRGFFGPHLVVTPTASLKFWERDLKSSTSGLCGVIYDGNGAERAILRQRYGLRNSCNIIVTSYRYFMEDERWFIGRNWDVVAIDECQNVKSYKRLLVIPRRTPILLRSLSELAKSIPEVWSLMRFLLPDILQNEDIKRAFFTTNAERDDLLQQILKGLSLFTVGVPKKLPKEHFVVRKVPCPMTRFQQQLYESKLLKGEKLAAASDMHTMETFAALRRICDHPDMVAKRRDPVTLWMDPLSFPLPLEVVQLISRSLGTEGQYFVSECSSISPTASKSTDDNAFTYRAKQREATGLFRLPKLEMPLKTVTVPLREANLGMFEVSGQRARPWMEHDSGFLLRLEQSIPKRDEALIRACQFYVELTATENVEVLTRRADGPLNGGASFGNKSNLLTGYDMCTPHDSLRFLPPRKPLYRLEDSGKIKQLGELLKTFRTKSARCLVITQLVEMQNLLEEFLSSTGQRYVSINDLMSVESCATRVKDFDNCQRNSCLLFSVREPRLFYELELSIPTTEIVLMEGGFEQPALQSLLDLIAKSDTDSPINVHTLYADGSIEESKALEANSVRPTENEQLMKRVDSIYASTNLPPYVDRAAIEGGLFALEDESEAERLSGWQKTCVAFVQDFATLANPPEGLDLETSMRETEEPLSKIQSYALRIQRLVPVDKIFTSRRRDDAETTNAGTVYTNLRKYLESCWAGIRIHPPSMNMLEIPLYYELLHTLEATEQLNRILEDQDEDVKLYAALRNAKAEEMQTIGSVGSWSMVETAEDLGFFAHAYGRLARTSMVTRQQKEKSAAAVRAEAEERQRVLEEKKRLENAKLVEKNKPGEVPTDGRVAGTGKTDAAVNKQPNAGAVAKKTVRKVQSRKPVQAEKKDTSGKDGIGETAVGKTVHVDAISDLFSAVRGKKASAETQVEAREPTVPWTSGEDEEITKVTAKYGVNARLLFDWMELSSYRRVGYRPYRSAKVFAERQRILSAAKPETSTAAKKSPSTQTTEMAVLKRHFEYLTRKVDAHRNKQNAAAGQFLQPHVSHSRAEKAVKFLTDRTPNPTDIIQRFPAPSSHVSGRKVEGTSGEKRRLLRSPMRDDTRGGGGKASVSGPVRRGGEDALGKLPSTNLVDIGPALQKSASNASLSSSTAHRVAQAGQMQPGVLPGVAAGTSSRSHPPPARRKRAPKSGGPNPVDRTFPATDGKRATDSTFSTGQGSRGGVPPGPLQVGMTGGDLQGGGGGGGGNLQGPHPQNRPVSGTLAPPQTAVIAGNSGAGVLQGQRITPGTRAPGQTGQFRPTVPSGMPIMQRGQIAPNQGMVLPRGGRGGRPLPVSRGGQDAVVAHQGTRGIPLSGSRGGLNGRGGLTGRGGNAARASGTSWPGAPIGSSQTATSAVKQAPTFSSTARPGSGSGGRGVQQPPSRMLATNRPLNAPSTVPVGSKSVPVGRGPVGQVTAPSMGPNSVQTKMSPTPMTNTMANLQSNAPVAVPGVTMVRKPQPTQPSSSSGHGITAQGASSGAVLVKSAHPSRSTSTAPPSTVASGAGAGKTVPLPKATTTRDDAPTTMVTTVTKAPASSMVVGESSTEKQSGEARRDTRQNEVSASPGIALTDAGNQKSLNTSVPSVGGKIKGLNLLVGESQATDVDKKVIAASGTEVPGAGQKNGTLDSPTTIGLRTGASSSPALKSGTVVDVAELKQIPGELTDASKRVTQGGDPVK